MNSEKEEDSENNFQFGKLELSNENLDGISIFLNNLDQEEAIDLADYFLKSLKRITEQCDENRDLILLIIFEKFSSIEETKEILIKNKHFLEFIYEQLNPSMSFISLIIILEIFVNLTWTSLNIQTIFFGKLTKKFQNPIHPIVRILKQSKNVHVQCQCLKTIISFIESTPESLKNEINVTLIKRGMKNELAKTKQRILNDEIYFGADKNINSEAESFLNHNLFRKFFENEEAKEFDDNLIILLDLHEQLLTYMNNFKEIVTEESSDEDKFDALNQEFKKIELNYQKKIENLIEEIADLKSQISRNDIVLLKSEELIDRLQDRLFEAENQENVGNSNFKRQRSRAISNSKCKVCLTKESIIQKQNLDIKNIREELEILKSRISSIDTKVEIQIKKIEIGTQTEVFNQKIEFEIKKEDKCNNLVINEERDRTPSIEIKIEEKVNIPPPPPNFLIGQHKCKTISCMEEKSSINPPPPPPNLLLLNSNSNKNSNIPPPPPPMLFGKGPPPPNILGIKSSPNLNLVSNAIPKKTKIPPRIPMKALQWVIIDEKNINETIWDEIKSFKMNIDFDRLEEEFSVRHSESLNTIPNTPKSNVKVTMLTPDRTKNAELILSKLKIPISIIVESIYKLDEKILNLSTVESLLSISPTTAEMDLVNSYNGEIESLAISDRYFIEVGEIPGHYERLMALKFLTNCSESFEDFNEKTELFLKVLDEIQSLPVFKKLLYMILVIGNYMNGISSKGGAYGFKLDAFEKLGIIKGNLNKKSLTHLIMEFNSNDKEIFDNIPDPTIYETLSRIPISQLSTDLKELKAGWAIFNKAIEFQTELEWDLVTEKLQKHIDPISSKFVQADEKIKKVINKYESLCKYLGDKPSSLPSELLMKRMGDFFTSCLNAKKVIEKEILDFTRKS